MFGASPSVREQEKGLTSWPTHPKARAHSGDQPLRPEAVVPRTVRRATDPVLLWPLRPEAVVPRTCLLYTSDAADDLLCVDLGGRRIIKKKKTPNMARRVLL